MRESWQLVICLTDVRRSSRTLSMTLGRPLTIPDDHINIPFPHKSADVLSSSEHPAATSISEQVAEMSVEFYNATM